MARASRRAGRQAAGAGLLVAAGAVLACAKPDDPPGGPPDAAPPVVLATRPESGALVPGWNDDAVIQFDEVIDEQAAGTGTSGLSRLVLLSPVAGEVRITWARSRIRVRPREGWHAARVYRLELRKGIVDLRRNRLDSARVIVFSTGPAIGTASLRGTALHWVEQRPLPDALIEAVPLPDSVGYVTIADSSGSFTIGALRPGRYLVYAAADLNGNRRRDRREPYDSTIVALDSIGTAALYAFVHDTTGPRLRAAAPVDSMTVRLDFSQPLDPGVRLDTGRVRLLALPDSTPIPLTAVMAGPHYDSLAAAERAAATPADTTPAKPGAVPGATPAAAPRPDTSIARRLLARRPVPSDRVVVRTARPLAAGGRVLVRVRGATNLTGASGDGQAVFVALRPTVADTTRRAPAGTPPRPR